MLWDFAEAVNSNRLVFFLPNVHHIHLLSPRAMAPGQRRDKVKEWLSDFFSPNREVRYMPDGKRFNGHTQLN
jgi:hypothetical protein